MNDFSLKLDPHLKLRLINIKSLFDQGFITPIPYIDRRDTFSTQIMQAPFIDSDDDSDDGEGGGRGTLTGLRAKTKTLAKRSNK